MVTISLIFTRQKWVKKGFCSWDTGLAPELGDLGWILVAQPWMAAPGAPGCQAHLCVPLGIRGHLLCWNGDMIALGGGKHKKQTTKASITEKQDFSRTQRWWELLHSSNPAQTLPTALMDIWVDALDSQLKPPIPLHPLSLEKWSSSLR